MNKNERLLNDVREYLNSDECKQVRRELQEFLNTKEKDLTKLTMLEPKYLLSLKDINRINNNELKISDFKINTVIKIEGYMEYGAGDSKDSLLSIPLESFARYTMEMIKYVRTNIDNEGFELQYCSDKFSYLFSIPDTNYDKPNYLSQDYVSDSLEGIEKYQTLQNWVLEDIQNRWS